MRPPVLSWGGGDGSRGRGNLVIIDWIVGVGSRVVRGSAHGGHHSSWTVRDIPVLDKVVDVGELGGVVLVGREDLHQVKEPALLGEGGGRGSVDVADGEGVSRPRTVQQGAGQFLQTMGGAEV